MLGNTVVGRYVFFEERPSRNVSISSTFYTSFCVRRSQKSEHLIVFSALLGSACAKAARRMLIKLNPGITKTRSFKQENLSLESKYIFLEI